MRLFRVARCLSADVAVVDGKWELRGVSDSAGKPLPAFEGQMTLVIKRTGTWRIEAYRAWTALVHAGRRSPHFA